ncbi:MAG: family 43 glycosylhydrolase [Treponema sp.]|nr:family 43 glycosylhydrolase [Treponema sp.]
MRKTIRFLISGIWGGLLIMSCHKNLSAAEPSKITEMQALVARKVVKLSVENNPAVAHKFAADPAVLVYKDTVYVYATNDMQQLEFSAGKEENKFNKINTLNLFASKDLVNWADLGEIPVAGKNSGAGDAKWAANSWAPAVAWKNIDGKDKFFLYFADSGNGIGVMTSDSPEGPFTDPLGAPLISRSTPNCANVNWLFDPAVFVDDDGTGYIYFGGGHNPEMFEHPKTARCARLGADMTSIEGVPAEIDAPYLFEDSGINKINGIYYYTYCANWTERPKGSGPDVPPVAVIAYMTSENPLGPFTYKGWTLRNPGDYFGAWGNNHHWIFDFKGRHYIAYHAQVTEKQAGLEKGGYRTIFINDFEVNADGSLPVQKARMDGVTQIGHFNPFERVDAATFHSFRNVAVTSARTLSPVADGGYVCVKGVDFGDGAAKIAVNVICGGQSKGGTLRICADHFGGNGTVLAEIPVGRKSEVEASVAKISGVHDLYFVFSGTFELCEWEFKK